MAWKGIDGRALSIEEFKLHVDLMTWNNWKPIGVVWHNTASPTLAQWKKYTRKHWMDGLSSYYQSLGWSAGPHLFIDDEKINLFTPLNMSGVHSPSFNAQYIGIEHVGDYSSEDDDSGAGLKVKENGIAATAILCARLGIPVDRAHIKLHKEDPRTNHDCPGKDMAADVEQSVRLVAEYMSEGGDHAPNWAQAVKNPTPSEIRHGITQIPNLNLRESSSASSNILATLDLDRNLDILGEAKNAETLWYHVKIPDKELVGWVASRYVKVL